MLAPFATLAFLVTLWLVAAVGTEILLSSGWRVAAALRGEVPVNAPQMIVRVRSARSVSARTRAMRALPQLRAAA
jgi:hypothetical protein